jgi:hypothetical protein
MRKMLSGQFEPYSLLRGKSTGNLSSVAVAQHLNLLFSQLNPMVNSIMRQRGRRRTGTIRENRGRRWNPAPILQNSLWNAATYCVEVLSH